MKVGIVGYGGVGKSAVFSVLTGQEVSAHGHGERHLASVEVMDPRLDRLREVFQPRKFTRARFDVEDFPALPRGAGQGLGEKVAALREPDALLLVLGHFEAAHMVLADGLQDPEKQLGALEEDLMFLDLEALEKRVARLDERRKKGGGDRAAIERERDYVAELYRSVEENATLPAASEDRSLQQARRELGLFLDKPKVVVWNLGEDQELHGEETRRLLALRTHSIALCAPVELEIAQIEGQERQEFLQEYGLTEVASDRLTREAYQSLDLIAFFTVGPDEVRAWPVTRGSDAVTAAGKIHSDLARGFIRAEVTPYEQTLAATDAKTFKSTTQPDLKGKDHVVEDGDVLNIRFSV
jgi:hypothetical protein